MCSTVWSGTACGGSTSGMAGSVIGWSTREIMLHFLDGEPISENRVDVATVWTSM